MNEMYTGGASGTLLRWARGPLIMTVMIDKKVEPTEFERIVEVDCLVNRDERRHDGVEMLLGRPALFLQWVLLIRMRRCQLVGCTMLKWH